MRQYPDLGKRLLQTFKGYLEAEKRDNPAVVDNEEWQQVYQNVQERERKAKEVRQLCALGKGFSPQTGRPNGVAGKVAPMPS